MKKYFAYIRVSTARQGEHGVSLQEQRAAIERHARQFNLELADWFEEQETAAKRGRPIWNKMLKQLQNGKAAGVIIHKIDRSARNLRDWADLGELIDAGVEVHFANESLDLNSRGGRLSADIQAVVAADFIRNLSEETKKGMYGRFKQGLYPLPAPLGYLDVAPGKPKAIDPVAGPRIKELFELYVSGRFSMRRLMEEMYERGFRSRSGERVGITAMHHIIHNPFYAGLIRIKKTGETFTGVHEPLISVRLFDQVQEMLSSQFQRRLKTLEHLFRCLVRCRCGYSLVAEIHDGISYYRCHQKTCPTKVIREELLEAEVLKQLEALRFNEEEKQFLREQIAEMDQEMVLQKEQLKPQLNLKLQQISERLNKLTDGFLDGSIEKDLYMQRKTALLTERCDVEDKLAKLTVRCEAVRGRAERFFQLAQSALELYKAASVVKKRQLLKTLSSKFSVDQKTIMFTLVSPFQEIANRPAVLSGCALKEARLGFWRNFLRKLLEDCTEHTGLLRQLDQLASSVA